MADMNRISPPGTVMVDDVGNCQVWSELYWQTKIPGNHMTAGGFAAMGFGIAGGDYGDACIFPHRRRR